MAITIAQALATAPLDAVDARVLLQHALGVNHAYLIAHADEPLSTAHNEFYTAAVARRVAGEPVAYITGTREFFSLEFQVTPAVLIPRPETELLVEFTLARVATDGCAPILELGTGSGCIAVSIARLRPRARIVAVDKSVAALAVAGKNARRHAVANLQLRESDWFSAVAEERFDVIVSNPPYVAAGDAHLAQGDLRFEPAGALVAGEDGLDCIRQIVAAAPHCLTCGGWLAFEHGYDQAARCRDLMRAAGFVAVFSLEDIAGTERVTGGRLDRDVLTD